MVAKVEESVLVVVDVQPTFLEPIWRRDEMLRRCRFLVECAKLLGVPVLATEQNPERMGGTDPELLSALPTPPLPKMSFGCLADKGFRKEWRKLDRPQAVIVGIETHICVLQTANELLDEELDVVVCVDAVSARSQDRHEIAVQRLRDEGAAIAHTETVVYEWMLTAEHPNFRDVLEVVKSNA